MELRTLLSTAVGRLSVRAADRRLDRRQRVSRPRTPPRSCRERARVAAHQCRRPRAPAAQINRRCPSSHCGRGSVFRVVRRLGFGLKIRPNRTSISERRNVPGAPVFLTGLGRDGPVRPPVFGETDRSIASRSFARRTGLLALFSSCDNVRSIIFSIAARRTRTRTLA